MGGDVTHLFEHIMCSEPTDGDRFMEMIQSLLVDGAVPNELRERVLSSFPQLKRAGDKMLRRGRREAKQVSNDSMEELAAVIRSRQFARGAALSRSLEALVSAKSSPMLECSVAQKKQRPASKAGSQKRKAWRWCRSD